MQIIHSEGSPLSEPMPSEPSGKDGLDGIGELGGVGEGSGVTSSRKLAVGTKNKLPVTAVL